MKRKVMMPFVCAVVFVAALQPARSAHAQSAVRRIEVSAKRFAFTPGDITLKRGEPVVLVLKSMDVAHGFRFKELGIEGRAGKGQTSEVAFTPSKLGIFVGRCSVFCGTGHGTMTLTIHVVD